MPPITVIDWELDGSGGMFVLWHDVANLDGLPLMGTFHITAESIAELEIIEKRVNSPCHDGLCSIKDRLQGRVGMGAHNDVPEIVAVDKIRIGRNAATEQLIEDWRVQYEQLVMDRIERRIRNIKGGAPYEVLEDARSGKVVAGKHMRKEKDDAQGLAQLRARNKRKPEEIQ